MKSYMKNPVYCNLETICAVTLHSLSTKFHPYLVKTVGGVIWNEVMSVKSFTNSDNSIKLWCLSTSKRYVLYHHMV